jgi:hypothetical protein
MQPPFFGSQLRPVPQAALFGVFEQLPAEQVSVVHAIKSSQSLSPQHVAQPLAPQHLPPLGQVAKLQLPLTQLPT